METIKIESYQNYDIIYDESKGMFIGTEKGEEANTFRSEKLAVLKDKIIEGKKNLQAKQLKQKALLFKSPSYGNTYTISECVAGTFGVVKRYSSEYLYCWITSGRMNRERVELERYGGTKYFKDTEGNRKLMAEIITLGVELDKFESKIKSQIKTRRNKLKVMKPAIDQAKLPIWEK